jgi:hypothetical protein
MAHVVDKMTVEGLHTENILCRPPAITATSTNGTLTLTATSNTEHIITGSATGYSVVLPNATTLGLGWVFEFWNISTQSVSIKNAGGGVITSLRPNGRTVLIPRDISTSPGLWISSFSMDSGNAFGSQLQYAYADAETSNNSQSTWANKLNLTTPSTLGFGDYLLNFQFLWRCAAANKNMDVRITDGASVLQNWQPFLNNLSERPLISGFLHLLGLSGSHTLSLDFRVGPANSTTVYMSLVRMLLWRIN